MDPKTWMEKMDPKTWMEKMDPKTPDRPSLRLSKTNQPNYPTSPTLPNGPNPTNHQTASRRTSKVDPLAANQHPGGPNQRPSLANQLLPRLSISKPVSSIMKHQQHLSKTNQPNYPTNPTLPNGPNPTNNQTASRRTSKVDPLAVNQHPGGPNQRPSLANQLLPRQSISKPVSSIMKHQQHLQDAEDELDAKVLQHITEKQLIQSMIARSLKIDLTISDDDVVQKTLDSANLIEGIDGKLTIEKLNKLHQEFNDADLDMSGVLDIVEFRRGMKRVIGHDTKDEEIDEIFMKMDVNCNGTVDWEEYLTYMLLDFGIRDRMNAQTKEPYSRDIHFAKTEYRDSVVAILFIPQIGSTQSDATGGTGRYFTCSKDGFFTFWSNDLNKGVTYHNVLVKGITSIWVTSAEVILESRLVVVTTTNCSMYWFHYDKKGFVMTSLVKQLPGCVMCMSYHKDMPSYLTWGDEYGGIGVMSFHMNISNTVVGVVPKVEGGGYRKNNRPSELYFTDISNGYTEGIEARYLSRIHGRYVRQVRYIRKIHVWVTCSKDTCTALFIGDLIPQKPEDRHYYIVEHGVNVFDYSERLNLIVTGGFDTLIRLWNPYATGSKLMGVFRGHSSPITQLLIDFKLEFLISVGENKDVHIFDLTEQTCTQSLLRKSFDTLGSRSIASAFLNQKTHKLILATKTLAIIRSKEEADAMLALVTINVPITDAIYNPLFKQIVTADSKSQIIVWNVFSGEKITQFTAHSIVEKGTTIEIELTAIAFDSSFRRLLTALRDGTVKIWNYNIAVLLKTLKTIDTQEISSVCWPTGRILVAGWNKQVIMHLDIIDTQSYIPLRPPHERDITKMAVLPPLYIASASSDGILMIYSMKTGFPQFRYRIFDPSATATVDFYVKKEDDGSDASKKRRMSRRASLSRRASRKSTSSRPVETHNLHVHNIDIDSRYSVEAMVFLANRQLTEDTAVLFTCLNNGMVLGWPMSIKGHCLGQFFAAYAEGESIYAAAVSEDNEFLVTGDSLGYLKVWDITHYLNPEWGDCCLETDILRTEIWLEFPFVRMRNIVDRMNSKLFARPLPLHMLAKCFKLAGHDVDSPHLVNCFKGHLGGLVSVQLIEIQNRRVIISSSADLSVRMWTIHGQFIGLLGNTSNWTNLKLEPPVPPIPKSEKPKRFGEEVEEHVAEPDDEFEDESMSSNASGEGEEEEEEEEELFEEKEEPPPPPKVLAKHATKAEAGTSQPADAAAPAEGATAAAGEGEEEESEVADDTVEEPATGEEGDDENNDDDEDDEETKSDKKSDAAKQEESESEEEVEEEKGGIGIPMDLRRVASYTTMYILETKSDTRTKSKWSRIRHAVVWIGNFLRSKQSKDYEPFKIPGGKAKKVAAFSNKIKDMIEDYKRQRMNLEAGGNNMFGLVVKANEAEKEAMLLRRLPKLTSDVLGKAYSKQIMHYRPIISYDLDEPVGTEVSPYRVLPLSDYHHIDVDTLVDSPFMADLRERHWLEPINPSVGVGLGQARPPSNPEEKLKKALKKAGWVLKADGNLYRHKVPLNSSNEKSFLLPALVGGVAPPEETDKKGDVCSKIKKSEKKARIPAK